ncbi:MAG: hypothetical protein AAF645_18970 [Myxococcota bacterium]
MRVAAAIAFSALVASGCGQLGFEEPCPPAEELQRYEVVRRLDELGSGSLPALSADMLRVVFVSERSGEPRLWESRRRARSERWQAPEPVSADLGARLTSLVLSEDGLSVFAVGAGVVRRFVFAEGQFNEDEEIRVRGREDVRAFVPDVDGTVVISAGTPRSEELLQATLEGASVRVLRSIDELNEQGGLVSHVTSGSGSIFYSEPFVARGTDFFRAQRVGDRYCTRQRLLGLSSNADDLAIWAAHDESTIVFASSRSGRSELYVAERRDGV